MEYYQTRHYKSPVKSHSFIHGKCMALLESKLCGKRSHDQTFRHDMFTRGHLTCKHQTGPYRWLTDYHSQNFIQGYHIVGKSEEFYTGLPHSREIGKSEEFYTGLPHSREIEKSEEFYTGLPHSREIEKSGEFYFNEFKYGKSRGFCMFHHLSWFSTMNKHMSDSIEIHCLPQHSYIKMCDVLLITFSYRISNFIFEKWVNC